MCISLVVSLGSVDCGEGRGAEVGACPEVCAVLALGERFPGAYGVLENAACAGCPGKGCPGSTEVSGRAVCNDCDAAPYILG
jgi:hypothetical protein